MTIPSLLHQPLMYQTREPYFQYYHRHFSSDLGSRIWGSSIGLSFEGIDGNQRIRPSALLNSIIRVGNMLWSKTTLVGFSVYKKRFIRWFLLDGWTKVERKPAKDVSCKHPHEIIQSLLPPLSSLTIAHPPTELIDMGSSLKAGQLICRSILKFLIASFDPPYELKRFVAHNYETVLLKAHHFRFLEQDKVSPHLAYSI